MNRYPTLIRQSTGATPDWVRFATWFRTELVVIERVTVQDVAVALGVSVATARSRWTGRKPWRLDELLTVAALVDRPLSHYLFNHESHG